MWYDGRMAEKTVVIQRGMGLPTLLFIVFLVLQLTGNIAWPWYAVAAPLLIPLGLGLLWVLFMLIVAVAVALRS